MTLSTFVEVFLPKVTCRFCGTYLEFRFCGTYLELRFSGTYLDFFFVELILRLGKMSFLVFYFVCFMLWFNNYYVQLYKMLSF